VRIFPDVSLEGLHADEEEILRYVGFRGQDINDSLRSSIKRCAALTEQAASPRFVTVESAPVRILKKGVDLDGLILKGKDIRLHLGQASAGILMGVTVGVEIERLIQYHRRQSMLDVLLIDAAATDLIEQICSRIENSLRNIYQKQGLDITDRFSCGYGDLPIEAQPNIIRVLDAPRAIGLTCSSSLMLVPQKSVTAILGVIPPGSYRSVRGCQNCKNRKHCLYRKEGVFCGNKGQAAQ
jgi:hypothetical protein